ncbi:unnamed protein product [Coregonus sp. 'balchen']|nr:unnamed protein product [Coregonus sp. 'balchen']
MVASVSPVSVSHNSSHPLLTALYHMMVTHRSMLRLTGAAWTFAVLMVLISVGLITRLSFCRSLVINSYFCDHGPLFRLAAPVLMWSLT